MAKRGRRIVRASAMALIAALGVAACSNADETAEPPSTTTTTTTSSAVPTTVPEAPSTTTPATTTTAPEWTDDELAVIAAYEAFQKTYVEGVLLGGRPFEPLTELTSAEFGAALAELLEHDRAAGLVAVGDLLFSVESVEVRAEVSELGLCVWDRIALMDGDQELVAASPEPARSTAYLVLVDDRWVLDGTETLSPAERCSIAE